MPSVASHPPQPRWYLVAVRVVLLTFLLSLLAFAVALLLGIVGIVALALGRNTHPDMTSAYRQVAFPAVVIATAVGLLVTSMIETRNYRQTRVLSGIARAGHHPPGTDA